MHAYGAQRNCVMYAFIYRYRWVMVYNAEPFITNHYQNAAYKAEFSGMGKLKCFINRANCVLVFGYLHVNVRQEPSEQLNGAQ